MSMCGRLNRATLAFSLCRSENGDRRFRNLLFSQHPRHNIRFLTRYRRVEMTKLERELWSREYSTLTEFPASKGYRRVWPGPRSLLEPRSAFE